MRALLPALPLALLAACGSDPAPTPTPTVTETVDPADALEQRERGPLSFAFDTTMMRAVEVETTFPPGYDETVQAAKLIPLNRAELLGQQLCSYGESGLPEECDPAKEAGLAFAILPERIDFYRGALLASGIAEEEVAEATVAGIEGFRFTAQAEGTGSSYTFLPAGEETVLVQRLFRGGEGRGAEAFGKVLESVAITLPDPEAEAEGESDTAG